MSSLRELSLSNLYATKPSETKKIINDKVGMKLLNRHDLTGSILQYSVYSYFHLNDLQTQLLSRKFGIISQPFMSFGTFSTGLQSGYSWGILRNAKFSGMVMDIDHIAAIQVDSNNNNQNWLSFNKQQGIAQSLNENLVPEMLLKESKEANSTQGISAIKALQLAHDKGQKIYQINNSNVNNILPMLSHDSQVITDIRNAVSAGKVVTTSQSSVSLNGWNGSGYIILDPYTGSGAYMISGGLNGGFTTLTDGHGNSFSLAAMVPSLDFLESETISKSLAYTKNIFEIYISQAQAFLDCNKEVILNLVVTIAIVLAILAAAAATVISGGSSSPATVPLMVVLIAMIPATANAGKGNSNQGENCVDDSCKTAQPVHRKAINVLGKEHNYKSSYRANPNSLYDICACNKGAITIVKGAGQCGRVSNFFEITNERWKNPIITWDGN